MTTPADTGGQRRRSLRNRVALTLALFGGGISLILAVVIFLLSHNLELNLVDEALQAELTNLTHRDEVPGKPAHNSPLVLHSFVFDQRQPDPKLPAGVADLSPNLHQYQLNGVQYRYAARVRGTQHYVALYNLSAMHRREHDFMLLLGISVALVTLISALAGRWLASLAIAPVTDLVGRVASLRPDEPHTRLAKEFPWIEVQRLAADFDAYMQRLQAFVKRERLFTGDVSHELRTPLTVIGGASQLLLENPALDDKSRERVARIARAITEMTEITEALLALAREQGDHTSTPSSCDVADVAEELIERQRSLLQNRPLQLRLVVDARPQLNAPRAVLAMVLGNLLRNAVNFTAEGEIELRVRPDRVEVRDTGTGIEDEDIAQLFEPYRRSAESPGSGLGLSLVQRLCEQQHWHIALRQRTDRGTLACLTFKPVKVSVPEAQTPVAQG